MRGIQIGMVALVICGAACIVARRRSRLAVNFLTLGFAAVALTIVAVPSAADWLASQLAVGRGADVVIYFLLLFLSFGWLMLYSKLRSQEERLVELARSIAISQAQEPERVAESRTQIIPLPGMWRRAS